MRHELWIEPDGCQTFCLKGVHGNAARALLDPSAERVWEVEAASHYEAMTLYYKYMGWGKYITPFPEQDYKTYCELGLE